MTSWTNDLSEKEIRFLRSLKAPWKIQDFLDSLPMNFRDTCYSPRMVLRNRKAHCMEGAMLAAVALRFAGYPPLVMDLKSVPHDDDHVVAVFRHDRHWGAISKTNHGVLRYREPIYKTIRELAMSYFHEYFLNDGSKTLRSYSNPVDLSRFDKRGWMTDEEDVEYVPEYVDDVRHYPMLSKMQISRLRKADIIERKMGAITEWSR
ncbi:MAG: hypothetical protein HOO67_02000 [Candidatus Peribacteraceae bacterium]|nr:hypothetical protein [Candidatus Peribacteraceae bacterium]